MEIELQTHLVLIFILVEILQLIDPNKLFYIPGHLLIGVHLHKSTPAAWLIRK
jgi:hypothetical protein